MNSIDNSWFKFVISEEKDIDEIEEDFIKTFELLKTKIILMPSTVERQDCCAKTRFVLEMAKKYNVCESTLKDVVNQRRGNWSHI